MNNKNVIYNLVASSMLQIVTIGLGMVLPRIILVNWGSEYNGLISTVITVMSYMVLFEVGISSSTRFALYKTIGTNDKFQTSVVINTARKFYNRMSIYYAIGVLLISIVYPLFIHTTIPYWTIFWVIFLQGGSGLINFAFRAAYQQLLNAEGKNYIISIIQLFTVTGTYVAKIIAILIFDSIVIMQLLGLGVMVLQVLVYYWYFKTKYTWLDKTAPTDASVLENNRYYIVQQIGVFAYSTVTVILSIFCSLSVVSVYSVYNFIFQGLKLFIGILRSSTNFVLGQAFHQSEEKFRVIYDLYTSVQIVLGTYLSSVCMFLIMGFVKLYTKGVNDIDYINYPLAIFFALNVMLDCGRGANLAGANIAGKAPDTTWRYIVEAGINLIVALMLVQKYGAVGVVLGGVVSGIWRTADSIIYFHKHVLRGSPFKEFAFNIINYIIFACCVVYNYYVELEIVDYFAFIKLGAMISIGLFIFYAAVFYVFKRKEIICFLNMTASEKQ